MGTTFERFDDLLDEAALSNPVFLSTREKQEAMLGWSRLGPCPSRADASARGRRRRRGRDRSPVDRATGWPRRPAATSGRLWRRHGLPAKGLPQHGGTTTAFIVTMALGRAPPRPWARRDLHRPAAHVPWFRDGRCRPPPPSGVSFSPRTVTCGRRRRHGGGASRGLAAAPADGRHQRAAPRGRRAAAAPRPCPRRRTAVATRSPAQRPSTTTAPTSPPGRPTTTPTAPTSFHRRT